MRQHIDLLGYQATDKVTGFSGIVECVAFDLYGCIQVTLRPPVNDKGESPDARWYDVSRLTLSGDRVMAVPILFLSDSSPDSYTHGAADKPTR